MADAASCAASARPGAGGCWSQSRSQKAGQPYQQGQLDGLCGIYSVVNAVGLLLACGKPLSTARCTTLFQTGLSIVGAEMPLQQAVCFGVEPQLWFEVIKGLAIDAARDLNLNVTAKRPFAGRSHIGFDVTRAAIDAALDEHAVVLVSLGGAHNHYTVIQARSATRWLLHDSSGLRWLAKAACGSERSKRRHQIAAAWVVTLSVAPRTTDPRSEPPCLR